MLINTCGFVDSAKKDSIDAILRRRRYAASRSSRSAAWRSATAQSWPTRCPRPTPCSGSTTTPNRRAPRRRRRRAARPALAARPAHAAADHARRTARPPPRTSRCPGTRGGPAARSRRLDDGPMAYLKLAVGLRPALHLLRDPVVPRLVRLAPPDDVLAEAALARRDGRARARARQRELHVLRQGPRRPAAAGDAAPDARGVHGSSAARPLPAAGRDAPGTAGGDRRDRGVAPYFDLSFQHASPTVLRRMRRFGATDTFLDLIAHIRELDPAARASAAT